MERRFYSSSPITTDECQLSGDEAHHLSRVLRAAKGDQVILFDNSGFEFLAEVTAAGRQHVDLRILHKQLVDRELPCKLHLGVALPKGDRQKWLIEKAVELGVTALTPLRAQHGVAQPTSETVIRLRRQIIEASKQCARNRLMDVDAASTLEDFCAATPAASLRLITHPYQTTHLGRTLATSNRPQTGETIYAAIGPEGGWSDAELTAAANSGWQAIGLGNRILRVETAVCTLAAVIAAWLEGSNT